MCDCANKILSCLYGFTSDPCLGCSCFLRTRQPYKGLCGLEHKPQTREVQLQLDFSLNH